MAGSRNSVFPISKSDSITLAIQLKGSLFHDFSDPLLLAQAFVHPSAVSGGVGSNQRLEFLGDRVLGLVVAEMLHEYYSGENEGALASRFTAMVRRQALDRVAREIDIGSYIILSRGEEENGGRDNPANLADTCEALIAAIFLDGGYQAAFKFISYYWSVIMKEESSPPKDAKSLLQELSQARYSTLPFYKLLDCTGPPHAPNFKIEVGVANFPTKVAYAGSKQAAEQSAAEMLLKWLIENDGEKGD